MGSHVERCTRAAVVTSIACCGVGAASAQDEPPAVVPYRPSIASPADLPAPGWPEVEGGVRLASGGEAARGFWAPVSFKLAWDDSWGLVISTFAYQWQRAYDDSTAHTVGDTLVALKYKLPVDEHLALGAEFGVALPTAQEPIGSGKADWGVNGIASFDYPGVHVDLNLAGIWLGLPDAGQGRWQGLWAVAVSHPLSDRFGVTGELAGLVQRGSMAQTQALVALNYNVSRALVLDLGVAAGLSRNAPDWQVVFGFTYQLGRWF